MCDVTFPPNIGEIVTSLYKIIGGVSQTHIISNLGLGRRLVPTCMNKPVNNTVQPGQFNHVHACQQHCSSWPASTMFMPVNNHVQAGQLKHVQACQQPCSSWPARTCTRLSTTMFTPVNRQKQDAHSLTHHYDHQHTKPYAI